MADDKKQRDEDASGGMEGGMAGGSAGAPHEGDSLKDASDEAVRELESEEEPHAGRGDYG